MLNNFPFRWSIYYKCLVTFVSYLSRMDFLKATPVFSNYFSLQQATSAKDPTSFSTILTKYSKNSSLKSLLLRAVLHISFKESLLVPHIIALAFKNISIHILKITCHTHPGYAYAIPMHHQLSFQENRTVVSILTRT
jgi:hypothetical protein